MTTYMRTASFINFMKDNSDSVYKICISACLNGTASWTQMRGKLFWMNLFIMNEVDLLHHKPAIQHRPIMPKSHCCSGTKYTRMLIQNQYKRTTQNYIQNHERQLNVFKKKYMYCNLWRKTCNKTTRMLAVLERLDNGFQWINPLLETSWFPLRVLEPFLHAAQLVTSIGQFTLDDSWTVTCVVWVVFLYNIHIQAFHLISKFWCLGLLYRLVITIHQRFMRVMSYVGCILFLLTLKYINNKEMKSISNVCLHTLFSQKT